MKTYKLVMLGAALAVAACGAATGGNDAGAGGGAGGGTGGGGGSAVPDCVSTTPVTNLDFLNACTDASVEKILKDTSWRAAGTTLPPLP